MDVIARINQIMEQQGLTRYQLAKMSGLSQSTVSNMYQRNTIPSVPTIQCICDALDISLAQFFAADEDQFMAVDEKQKEVLELFILLDSHQQDAILNLIRSMQPGR